MKKSAIIYSSKYGATRQYAEWLGEELALPLFITGSVDKAQLSICDFVVIGSSVYIGKLLIRDWLRKNAAILKNKKLFLFVVCGSSSDKEKQKKIIADNIPDSLLELCSIFFMPGRLDIKKLSWKDRLLLKLGSRLEKNPVAKKAMLTGIDGVKKENSDELANAVRSFRMEQKEGLQHVLVF